MYAIRSYYEDLDYTIRQVSDRYRNPKNAPDAFEAEALQKFYATPSLKEVYAITSLHGAPVFRYMQPFRAEQSCLECHGDPADAPEFIKKLFPQEQDQAYNYRIGEVRGAASVTIPMAKLSEQIFANVRNRITSYNVCYTKLLRRAWPSEWSPRRRP